LHKEETGQVKDVIKSLAGRLGYEITRLDSHIEIDSPWGPNILLYALNDLAQHSSDPLTIVQIGANDGSDQDPLQPFLVTTACQAVLIEPMEHPFSRLQARYAGSPHIHTLQVAISDVPGETAFHYITDADGAPDLTLFSSFDRDTVERNLQAAKQSEPRYDGHRVETKIIEAKTLKTVLEDLGIARVDAVVVDVEGFDDSIVTSFLNDGVEPKIIRFEYCNLSRRSFRALSDLLRAKGYEISRVGIDVFCQKVGLLR
jgi:FkbM family methyltransferase